MTSNTGQLLEALTDGVAALIGSEQWAAMLAAAAKFHCYSANNQLLILLQAPRATRVAGFRRWQSLGRQVRKGEKGIAILAPCRYRPTKTNPTGQEHNTSTASNSDGETTGPKSAGQLSGMRVAHVFNVSQTDGEPLPEITPEPLTGQCRGANGYTDPAARLGAGPDRRRGSDGRAGTGPRAGAHRVRALRTRRLPLPGPLRG